MTPTVDPRLVGMGTLIGLAMGFAVERLMNSMLFIEQPCYSQRKTLAESAVQTANNTASAATSPTWVDQASPFQIPWSSGTA